MTAPTAPTLSNWLSIFALGLIWGGTFMVVSIALEGYGPLTVACARTTLGALALLILMIALRRPLPNRAALPIIAIIGVLNTALPFSLLSWGQQFVPSAFAGISMAALPLFVLPLAHFFTDEALSLRRGLGVLVGFSGALVLIGPGVLRLGTGMEPLGQLACLGATICYAGASIMTRRCPPVDPITLAAMTLMVGSVILIPSMLAVEGVPGWTDTRAGLAILFLGFVPTALAALLRVMVIRSAGSVFMTLVNYQVPLWSVFFGWAILDEALPLTFFAALALILCGVAVSQWRNPIRIFGSRA
ncbi:MAG: DMT family transporter [Flavimaricola sp.]|nr:DMT family transporter [Flavimaricola sp.]